MADEDRLDEINQVALELYEKYRAAKIVIELPNHRIEVHRPLNELAADGYPFIEAHKYLKNARRRIRSKTPEGYSDCKANCRNALMSLLKELTGKDVTKGAVKELHRQGILGEREAEFIEAFDNFVVILHGIDSKGGSHPPMTRSEDDAKLALNITTSVIDYIVNQCTWPRV